MSDLISRQAAIDALGERPMVWTSDDDYALGERNQYDIDRLAIETVPSAERHGRWIKTRMPVTGAIEIKCSECDQKYYTAFPLAWGYCPNCGARMDGE